MALALRAIPVSAFSKSDFLWLWVVGVWGKDRAKPRLCAEQTWHLP